jgi:hypothetical protein
MFVVQTTWQRKRHSHSWLTCITPSRATAESRCRELADPAATHRLLEIPEEGFPVFFVSDPDGYRHVSRKQLQELLASSAISGEGEEVLFNVYCFSGEYLWGAEFEGGTEWHHHVTNESLAHFRSKEGTLFEVVCGEA